MRKAVSLWGRRSVYGEDGQRGGPRQGGQGNIKGRRSGGAVPGEDSRQTRKAVSRVS